MSRKRGTVDGKAYATLENPYICSFEPSFCVGNGKEIVTLSLVVSGSPWLILPNTMRPFLQGAGMALSFLMCGLLVGAHVVLQSLNSSWPVLWL